MTNLLRSLRRPATRSDAPSLPFNEFLSYFAYEGLDYGFIANGTLSGNEEKVGDSFLGYVRGAYKRNGVIYAVERVRLSLFSEARFQFRRMAGGRPGDLFGTQALRILERPGGRDVSVTTGDLLRRMLLDVDLAGNWYGRKRPGRIQRLRPDWMTIILGSETGDPTDVQKLGYVYEPGGSGSGMRPVPLLLEEVAHFAPSPDPEAEFRGMSWLTPVIRDIQADSAAMTHKQKFFENGATPNLVVKLNADRMNPAIFEEWVDKVEGQHTGVMNAYKTLYLAAGSDANVIGSDMRQIDFKVVQGAGETRIAADGGIHPVIVGLSEGLQGSSLNAGNFNAARRLVADATLRPLWRDAAGSLSTLVDVPVNAELWYDDRDIAFLQEDRKDDAEIQQMQAQTIATLVKEGFTSDSAKAAVMAGDMGLLEHTGMVSVQLHPPGSDQTQNGNGQPALPASTS